MSISGLNKTRRSTGSHKEDGEYLSPSRDVDRPMRHVGRIEYSIVVRLPGGGVKGL